MASLLSDENIHQKIALIKSTEAYVFLIYNVSLRRSNTGTYHFNAKANELYSNEIKIQHVIEDLNFWIYGNDEVTGYFDRYNFYSNLKELFQRDSTNGYGDWKYLKYLLFEYELSKNEDPNNLAIKYKELSTTAVIPSIPLLSRDWQKSLYQFSPSELKYIKGSLGNYILSLKANASKGPLNDFNSTKIHFQCDLINAQELQDFDHWNYDSVLERGLRILNFMENRWNIGLGDEQQKKELLFLDFPQREGFRNIH